MSGYRLYKSPSLHTFFERFSDVFVASDPLSESLLLIVQNAGLVEWLTRSLAQKRGGVMGMRTAMPEQAMRELVMGFPLAREAIRGDTKDHRLLFSDGLRITLFKALQEFISSGEPVFDVVAQYAESMGDERLWPLAEVLATVFHYYGMNCPVLIDAWNANQSYFPEQSSKGQAEAWQRLLWNRVFRPLAPYTHLSRIISEIVESGDIYDGEMSRIVLFGSTFLGERGMAFFRHLARFIEVHHFLMSPYAGEHAPRNAFTAGNAGIYHEFNMLIHQLEPDEKWEDWNTEESDPTVLGRLRTSLIQDQPFEGDCDDDGSLAIHEVSGIRRTVEILKDRILQALRDDDSLAPTQIGVLSPDIALYAPYIETIFPSFDAEMHPSKDNLFFNLTDLPTKDESPFPSAFSDLLNLPGSRFGCSSILRLAENPCFIPTARRPTLAEDWRKMWEELNVRWGIDAEHRSSFGAADKSGGSWAQAFERIFSGYFHNENDSPNLRPFPDLSDTSAEDAGLLIHTVLELDSRLRTLDTVVKPLREWVFLWERIVSEWLNPRSDEEWALQDENDRLALKKTFRDLLALCDDVQDLADYDDNGIPWLVFRGLLDEFRSTAVHHRGRYLATGITCASLKPTRAIPFRRIYVLGLDEGLWPGNDNLTGFDLREDVPRAVNLSRNSVNRFALVEVLFSAKEHLALFYTDRDSERGEKQAPATPVTELMGHLGAGAKNLIRHHPLTPFDPVALTGQGPLATASEKVLELSRARNNASPLVDALMVPLPFPEEASVEWQKFVRFLRNPVESFYRRRLGAQDNTGVDISDEGDILEADSLEWWQWRDERIRKDLPSLLHPENMVQEFRRELALKSAVAQTAVVDFQAAQWQEESMALAEQLKRAIKEGLDMDSCFSCRLVESGTSFRFPEHSGEQREFPAPLVHTSTSIPLSITGGFEGIHLLRENGHTDSSVWILVDFVSAFQLRAQHKIRSWVAALTLAAALGADRPREIRVFHLGRRDFKAHRYYFDEKNPPDGTGGEKRLLRSPHQLLERLVNFYNAGLSAPIPLYPEMAEILEKGKPESMDDFRQMFTVEWNNIIHNHSIPYSSMRNCTWRQQFLTHPFSFVDSSYSLWKELYNEGGIL